MIARVIAAVGVVCIALVGLLLCALLVRVGAFGLIFLVILSSVGWSLSWTGFCLATGVAFSESATKGLCCIFVPFYVLIYAASNCSNHLTTWAIGFVICIGVQFAAWAMPHSGPSPQNLGDPQQTAANDWGRIEHERALRAANIPVPAPFNPPTYTPPPQPPIASSPTPSEFQPDTAPQAAPPTTFRVRHIPGRFGQTAPPAETPAATRPEPATFGAYVARAYADWIGDDGLLMANMRWLKLARRPAIGLRWGVGVTMGVDTPRRPTITPVELHQLTGPIGPEFVRLLTERLNQHRDGPWSTPAPAKVGNVPVLLATSEDELIAQAGRENLDGLVLISMSAKRIGLKKTLRVTMIVRLVDVLGNKATYSSAPLNSQKAKATQGTAEDASVQLVQEVMAKLDEQYSLAAFPPIDETAAQRRAVKLAEAGASAAQSLRALAELRYYQAKKLLSQDDALRAYEAIIGAKGKILATGDGPERTAVVEDWFGSQIAR
jgi:hypothetical protein